MPTKADPSPPTDIDWGLDTIRLWFSVDIEQCDRDSDIWRTQGSNLDRYSGRTYDTLIGNLAKPYGDIRVTLNVLKQMCSLHFNAARMVSPKPKTLLHPAALIPLVEGILADLDGIVRPMFDALDKKTGEISRDINWASQCSVSRLDAARNLQLDDPERVKEALTAAIPRNHKTTSQHNSSGGGWTLANVTKDSGRDRIYDKDAELEAILSVDAVHCNTRSFRFETQLQGHRLKLFGLKTLNQVNDERVWFAIWSRWSACRWGVSVGQQDSMFAATSHLTPTVQERLIGYLYLVSKGHAPTLATGRTRHMGKLARDCGLTPGLPLDKLGTASRFLDLQAGRLVDLPAAPTGGATEVSS